MSKNKKASELELFQILLLVFNFAFEFLNTTVTQLVVVSTATIAAYKRRLRLIILTMFNKNQIKLGGEGKIVEIDESLFIKVKHNRGHDTRRPKVWVFGLYERATIDQPKRVLFLKLNQETPLHCLTSFTTMCFQEQRFFLTVGQLTIE